MKNKKLLLFTMLPCLLIIVAHGYFNMAVKIPELPPITSVSLYGTGMPGSKFIVKCQGVDKNDLKKAMNNLALNHPGGWFRVNPFINSIPVHYIELNDSGSEIELYRDAIAFVFYENGQKIPLQKIMRKDEVQEFIDLLCAKSDDIK